jgi:hypothetical protein
MARASMLSFYPMWHEGLIVEYQFDIDITEYIRDSGSKPVKRAFTLLKRKYDKRLLSPRFKHF